MKRIFRNILLFATALSFSIPTFAGDGGGSGNGTGTGSGSTRTFQLRKHEIAIGGAIGPGSIADGIYAQLVDALETSSSYDGYADIYKRTTYEETKVTDSWWLSYTYNFNKRFAIQALFSYEGRWVDYHGRRSTYKRRVDNSRLVPMVSFRFSWLNRPIVRMYSSVGAGLVIYPSASERRVWPAGQVTLVGISVGKKLYGYAESGIGMVWVGGCAGIGYRF